MVFFDTLFFVALTPLLPHYAHALALGKGGAGGFQVQALAHGNGQHAVAVSARNTLEGMHAGQVGARREADEEVATHLAHVTAVDRAGRLDHR